MKKGYKFSTTQLADRKKKRKGKWSKLARAKHSVRMKARFAEKRKSNKGKSLKDVMNGLNGNTTLKSRLGAVVEEVQDIMSQLG